MKFEKIYWFIATSTAIFLLDFAGLLTPVRNPLDRLVISVKSEIFRYESQIKNFSSTVFSYREFDKIAKQNYTLTKLSEEQAMQIRRLTDENARLRTQLEAPFPASFKFLPAQVISLSQVMEVDAGTEGGVRVGQIVVDGQSLVGKVSWTSAKRSKIILLSDPDFKIGAVTSRGTRGEVTGQGGQSVVLAKVLQKDPLFIDDQVITAGEEFTPANLLIGKISHIILEEAATYKQAKIDSVINYSQERTVFIITSL